MPLARRGFEWSRQPLIKALQSRLSGDDVRPHILPIEVLWPTVQPCSVTVRLVRFDGWQDTHAGEREVKLALRKTLFKYKIHQDQDMFDRAYAYIREYY